MNKLAFGVFGICFNTILLMAPYTSINSILREDLDPRFIVILCISALLITCDLFVPDKELRYFKSVKYHAQKYDFFSFVSGVVIYLHFLTCFWNLFQPKPVKLDYIIIAAGVGISLTGLVIRLQAILTLGRFFTEQLKVLTFQPLIKNGIYSWIRHPSYLGLLMILWGVCLIAQSIWGIIYYFLIVLPMVLIRVRHEEKVMRIGFGTDYDEYCQKTQKLIPYIF